MKHLLVYLGIGVLLGIGVFAWLDHAYHVPVQKNNAEKVRVEILDETACGRLPEN